MHDSELKSFDFKPLLADPSERAEWLGRFSELPVVVPDQRALWDLDFLALGVYSPLTGFMNQDDYENVLETRRLMDDTVWPIPIMLPVSPEKAESLETGRTIGIVDPAGNPLAILELSEIFDYNKEREAELVFTTKESGHPGVAELYDREEFYLAGAVKVLNRPELKGAPGPELTPADMRAKAAEKGWKRITGLRTEALPHRALEYYMKKALESADGLHLHTQGAPGDSFPADLRGRAFQALLRDYFPDDKILTGGHSARPRYAGPREALLHALMERNYGCTDIIINRDYAGAGNFYGTYDAFDIFEDFELEELGIRPVFQENVFYSREKARFFARGDEGAHEIAAAEQLPWNERELLDRLEAGEMPGEELMRPEAARILLKKD